MCLVRSPVSLDYRPPSTSPSRSLSLCLVFFLSLLPHTNTNQKPINSPTILPLPSLPLLLPSSPCPLYTIPSCVPHQNIMNTKAALHVSPPPSLSSHSSSFSPLSCLSSIQAPPFNPCSPSLSCVRTGFLSADGVSLLCSFSSKGI